MDRPGRRSSAVAERSPEALTVVMFAVLTTFMAPLAATPARDTLFAGSLSAAYGLAALGVVSGLGITLAVTLLSLVRSGARESTDDVIHHLSTALQVTAGLSALIGLAILAGGNPDRMPVERTLGLSASVLVTYVLLCGHVVVPEHISRGYAERERADRRARIAKAINHLESSSPRLWYATPWVFSTLLVPAVLVNLPSPGSDVPLLVESLLSTAFCTVCVLVVLTGLAARALFLVLAATLCASMVALALLARLTMDAAGTEHELRYLGIWAAAACWWTVALWWGLCPQRGLRPLLLQCLYVARWIVRDRPGNPETSARFTRVHDALSELRSMTGREARPDS